MGNFFGINNYLSKLQPTLEQCYHLLTTQNETAETEQIIQNSGTNNEIQELLNAQNIEKFKNIETYNNEHYKYFAMILIIFIIIYILLTCE